MMEASSVSAERLTYPVRVAILGLIALAVALLFNGQRSLWDTSETRYAESAREMVTSGDWLVPHLEGVPHLTKPPVTYWTLAASMIVFGRAEWAVRLPGAVAFAVSVLLVALIAEELTGNKLVALMAAVFQLAAPLALAGSHVVTSDGILAAVELGYVWAFWKTLNAPTDQWARLWALLTWAIAGVAFLTKGPPALLLGLVCLVYSVWNRKRLALNWRALIRPEAVLLFVAVALSWFAVVYIRVPNAVLVWKTEALHKVLVESDRNMASWIYLPILFGGALPGILALGIGVWRLRQTVGVTGWMDAAAIQFCLLWVGLPLAIFMTSKTRLPLYVLPLIPGVSILGAIVFSQSQSVAQDEA